MIKIIKPHCFLKLSFSACLLALCANSIADGFITKEVYSFNSKNGSPVFTDKKPVNKQNYKTQTIEAAKSTASYSGFANTHYRNPAPLQRQYTPTLQPQRIIVEHRVTDQRKLQKKKRSIATCKYYKKKLAYYSDKMKQGYKSSQYKRLEENRKKYRKLLFNRCETKTFSD